MTSWKKTLGVSWVAQFISLMGFTFVLPFLPYYIRELGVVGDANVRRWAGIVTAASPVTMMIFALIWGSLADRYGRKLMLLRSMFGAAIALGLMAVAQNVGHLVVCRLLQGALSGTVVASTALVAGTAPAERSGFALGMMQSANYFGASAGPLIGGILADAFGYRRTFLIAAGLLVVGGLLVTFALKEQSIPPDRSRKGERGTIRQVFAAAGFMAAAMVFVMIRFANTVQAPVFSLFVEELRGTREGLNTITGSIFFTAGLSAGLCGWAAGRLSDAWGHKKLLMVFTILAGCFSLALANATSVIHLYVLRALFGAAVAGLMAAANAIIRSVTPDNNIGKAYGVAWSLSCGGWVIGAVSGGCLAAQLGLRAPFYLMGFCQFAAALLVFRLIRSPAAAHGKT